MFFNKKDIIFFLIIFISPLTNLLYSQEPDIVPYLKEIEKGNIISDQELLKLKEEHPSSPSILYLEGIISNDGEKALKIYNELLHDFPESNYADASLFRIFSYYFSIGSYEMADKNLQRLKRDFPSSPYLKLAGNKNFSIRDENEILEEKKSQHKITGKFTIQAGAFSNPDNAKNLKRNFESSGYFSEIREKNVGGTDFKVVYIGNFDSYDEAESFLSLINSRYNLSGKIIEKTW